MKKRSKIPTLNSCWPQESYMIRSLIIGSNVTGYDFLRPMHATKISMHSPVAQVMTENGITNYEIGQEHYWSHRSVCMGES